MRKDDLNAKAEIGVYCQHFGKPENSKFSVVLLHDMAQGHNRWPNIWEKERWNVNKDILDAIEYYTTGEGCTDFMKWKMQGKYMPANMWS